MPQATILIVDDDPAILKVLTYSLSSEKYLVKTAGNAEQGLDCIHQEMPDLVLVDWMMPDISGTDMIKRLRANKQTRDLPIIMLTAKVTEDDQVKGLLVGADDYMVKPFSVRELLARIRSLLRRAKPHLATDKIELGGIELDPAERRVKLHGKSIDIGSTEFKLLHFFLTHPEKVYSRTQILDYVWGINTFIQERTVDVHILRLRKLLKSYGMDSLIETVRGLGYRLSEFGKDDQ